MPNLVPSGGAGKRHELATRCQQVDEHLKPISYLEGRLDSRTLDEADLEAAPSQLAMARQAWAAVSQPATPEEIAVEFGKLFANYPNLPKNTTLHSLVETLLDDVVDDAPSIFVLVSACRVVRQNYKFVPTIAEVFKELRKASSRAWKNDQLVGGIPMLEKHLADAKPLLSRWREEHEEDEARELGQLYQKAKENPINVMRGFWMDSNIRELMAKEFPPERFPELWDGVWEDDE